ncbi:unnamed protein product [Mytilus coruscus]|uniref:Uncharacterized protein n=1 Tax=Mytilus coruscus TaxID=42192 RepID=A0A6J8C6L9_MYTCO|nr:unnamed protein product [Mytilus coruscus]
MSIHSDLKDIKKSLQDTVIKSDLEYLVKQSDLKELVTSIVSQLLNTLKDSITAEFNSKLREKTGQLQDNVDSLNMENHLLKEKLREKEIKIKELDEKVVDCNTRSVDALKSANYNEQYSRKHNIRIVNYPEKKNENLHAEFIDLIKKDLKINLEPTDLIAIHRIPGKEGAIRPIIAKVRNTETKIKIMRSKKGLKKDIKFHDDITQKNSGLMSRLNLSGKLENVWFYNCSVYGKLQNSKNGNQRIKFGLFDNIEEKIRKKIAS